VLMEQGISKEEEARIRRATRENRPLANLESVLRWEAAYNVELRPGKLGRPPEKRKGLRRLVF
jgi:hypothetical protein